MEIQKGKLLLKKTILPLFILLFTTIFLYKFNSQRGYTTLPYAYYLFLPLWILLVKIYINRNYSATKDENSISISIIPRIKFIRTLPFYKCKDISIKQDSLDRLLGIYKLIISSSSDKVFSSLKNNVPFNRLWMWDFYGDEFQTIIEGLSKKDAEQLKVFLKNKSSSMSSTKEIESSFIKNMYMGAKLTGNEVWELLVYLITPFIIIWLIMIYITPSF